MERGLNPYVVVLDGIDKTGKDLIAHYVFELSGKRYIAIPRGIISMIAYDKIYNRGIKYDLEAEKNAPVLNVLLTVNKDDWEIRCKVNNEPAIDYDEHHKAFIEATSQLMHAGILVRSYNTSDMTPVNIAKNIVAFMHSINNIEDVNL